MSAKYSQEFTQRFLVLLVEEFLLLTTGCICYALQCHIPLPRSLPGPPWLVVHAGSCCKVYLSTSLPAQSSLHHHQRRLWLAADSAVACTGSFSWQRLALMGSPWDEFH